MEQAQLDERARNLDAVVATALGDLRGWYETILEDSPERVAAGFRDALPATVVAYGDVAATLAADWYATARPTARGWEPVPQEPEGLADEIQRSLGFAIAHLFAENANPAERAWDIAAGKVQLLVAGHDRATVEWNAERDPLAGAWRRVARADACAFCSYLATVVDSGKEDAASKKYHDHCHCQPVPMWKDESLPEGEDRERRQRDIDAARQALLAERQRVGYDRMPRSRRPRELALTTKNILARMREQGYR